MIFLQLLNWNYATLNKLVFQRPIYLKWTDFKNANFSY